eukprot:GHVR01105243.1.p2 GENE.GHVR01105243.1~~GHVR01105243.1.p2  ORF type:complete len:108 (+),score=21.50 GHVR01105243.1:140-463(+)
MSFGHTLALLAVVFHGMSFLYSHGTGTLIGPFPTHSYREVEHTSLLEGGLPHCVHLSAYIIFTSIGIFISSISSCMYTTSIVITMWGILAGGLYTLYVYFTIISVHL